MTITEKQEELIEEFSFSDDWMDRYEVIIDMGKDLPEYPEAHRQEENLIKGCQSRVWLHAAEKDGLIHFQADSDAIITKGLIAMLIEVLSGQPAKAILESDLHFLKSLGLHEHLSPTRSNGLASMVKQMKAYALAMTAQS